MSNRRGYGDDDKYGKARAQNVKDAGCVPDSRFSRRSPRPRTFLRTRSIAAPVGVLAQLAGDLCWFFV